MDADDLEDIRLALPGARSQVKACQRLLRSTAQMLADLEERLDRALDAQPKEAQRNGKSDKIKVAG